MGMMIPEEWGGAGMDSLSGGTGMDLLEGGAGDDSFAWQAGDGQDTMEGGLGTDSLTITGSDLAEVFELMAQGGRLDVIQANKAGSGVDAAGVEQVTLNARGGDDAVTVHDLAGTDVLALTIDAGAGNDRVDASALPALGVTLRGGAGNDILIGGKRNDRLEGDAASDLLIGDGGHDTLLAARATTAFSAGRGTTS